MRSCTQRFKTPFSLTDGAHRKLSNVIQHYSHRQMLSVPENHSLRLGSQDSTIEGAVNLQKEEPLGYPQILGEMPPKGIMGPWPISFSLLLLDVVMSNLFQQTLPAGATNVLTKAQGNESTQSWNGASRIEDQCETKKSKPASSPYILITSVLSLQ